MGGLHTTAAKDWAYTVMATSAEIYGAIRLVMATGDANGSNRIFSLPTKPWRAFIFRNGSLVPESDYSLSDSTIIFKTPPPNGAVILAIVIAE